MLSTEELCSKWALEGPDPIRRWWLLLSRLRQGDRPYLKRHVHYEVVYRDSVAVYVYDEARVLHLVWAWYETKNHPLCTQLMLSYGSQIKRLVKAARSVNDDTTSSLPDTSPIETPSQNQ